jgi:excinuclease UvrABC helicase subunit UvrB
MKLSGIVIIASVIIALGLTFGGTYITIDNLINPQGNLFEGIVLASLGVVCTLLLVIASNLGRTIQLFTDIYTQQVEMQQAMNEYFEKMTRNRPKSIGDILGGMQSSISITDLETGETSTRPLSGDNSLERINEIIMNAFNKKLQQKQSQNPEDMEREQLEQELAKAVKNDDFEKAKEIKDLIKKLDGDDDNPEEKK